MMGLYEPGPTPGLESPLLLEKSRTLLWHSIAGLSAGAGFTAEVPFSRSKNKGV